MRYARALRLSAIAAVGAAASVTPATAVGAGQVYRETNHEESSAVIDDFCGAPGLTVEFSGVWDSRIHAVPHGPDRLDYFLEHASFSGVWTNVANGKFVTAGGNGVNTTKDLRVIDNGDGTLTLLSLSTGNGVIYGQDGKAIARDPGQSRFEYLIDDGGTPTDPSDDEFLADLGRVKGSTGRSDDYCEAFVSALS